MLVSVDLSVHRGLTHCIVYSGKESLRFTIGVLILSYETAGDISVLSLLVIIKVSQQ